MLYKMYFLLSLKYVKEALGSFTPTRIMDKKKVTTVTRYKGKGSLCDKILRSLVSRIRGLSIPKTHIRGEWRYNLRDRVGGTSDRSFPDNSFGARQAIRIG